MPKTADHLSEIQRGALGGAAVGTLGTGVNKPNLPDIKNIHDLMPPLEFMTRIDPMLGSNLAQLQAAIWFSAMQKAAIAEMGNALEIEIGTNLFRRCSC